MHKRGTFAFRRVGLRWLGYGASRVRLGYGPSGWAMVRPVGLWSVRFGYDPFPGVGEWMATTFVAVAPRGPTFDTFAFLRSISGWEWAGEGSWGVDGHNFWSSCSARAYFRHLCIFEVPR